MVGRSTPTIALGSFWSDCYCSAYHFANDKGKAESRRQSSRLVEEDRMDGFLAYDNGRPVGSLNMVVWSALLL